MDARIEQLLNEYSLGKITKSDVWARLPAAVPLTKEYVCAELNAAIDQPNHNELDRAVTLLWLFDDHEPFLAVLHRLLLTPHHYQHQYVTRLLQRLRSPSSVPYIRAALETGFDYLDYTASKPAVIAKWFSWALHDIGTPDAIETIREFTERGRKGIRREMRYRLQKMGL